MSDLITISIPTYRRPTYLLHCLHSCLAQDYRPLEIDVSDNSLTDETRTLVESVPLPAGITLRYWRNSPSIGPVENCKRLFAAARGHRFVWMNDDDVLLPGAVSAMSDAFSLAPDVIVSYGLEQVINMAGELLPDRMARYGAEYGRLREYTGLRRDLLVCAFWCQIPHVGFLVLTEAARKVGIRDRSEVGLAVDTDFAVRLAQAYKGSAHVFIDRVTIHSRVGPSTLSQTSLDVAWKFYDYVRGIDNLSPQEALARDRMLTRIQPLALREHSIAHGRLAAMRIFLSRPYRSSGGMARWLYSLGLIAMPNLIHAMHTVVKQKLEERRRLSATRQQPRVTEEPSIAGEQRLPVPDHP